MVEKIPTARVIFYVALFIFTIAMLIVFRIMLPREGEREHGATNAQGEVERRMLLQTFAQHPALIADGFDFPVGAPNAKGYYVAQGFGEENARFGGLKHLGEDWNGKGGGDTDLGDPVYSVANGIVTAWGAYGPGWGNVLRIAHAYVTNGETNLVESLYAHLLRVKVTNGQHVRRGERVGAIGNADGRYLAHLHFEIRLTAYLPLGGGYAASLPPAFIAPRSFIRTHRPR